MEKEAEYLEAEEAGMGVVKIGREGVFVLLLLGVCVKRRVVRGVVILMLLLLLSFFFLLSLSSSPLLWAEC